MRSSQSFCHFPLYSNIILINIYQFRRLKKNLIGVTGRITSSEHTSGIFLLSLVKLTSKLRKIFEMMLLISYMANLWPMQFRGPAENGM